METTTMYPYVGGLFKYLSTEKEDCVGSFFGSIHPKKASPEKAWTTQSHSTEMGWSHSCCTRVLLALLVHHILLHGNHEPAHTNPNLITES